MQISFECHSICSCKRRTNRCTTGKKSRKKHHLLYNQHDTTFVDASGDDVSSPAADLLGRKNESSRIQIVLTKPLNGVPCH